MEDPDEIVVRYDRSPMGPGVSDSLSDFLEWLHNEAEHIPSDRFGHARITIEDSIMLEDLGSKNGTWLKDERLTGPRALVDGDVLRLGFEKLTIRLARHPKSTESADMFRDDLDVPSG